ncbi:VOC family protein [Paenibacillus sp. PR3]|uniref:VOC family protein n=1 Tax=Paenibacillus terricola TaxID=2763503 RepID=A0ABR8N583_9BACL|nr:VOC family protein [Paenibacillus terricola]MBD3921619.1 VOC family protein [Paenibacillus terricola]
MSYITRLAGVEIPVSNLKAAIEWYEGVIGVRTVGEFNESWKEAMLDFPGHPAGIYLVQTDSADRLKFHNTNHGYTQSVVDFYTEDLAGFHQYLLSLGVPTNRQTIDVQPGEISGFGFFDPDGNSLGATNG